MTVLIPVDPHQPTPGTSTPTTAAATARSFASPPDAEDDDAPELTDVVRRVRNARRIVVISGAGVSTAAAIPDFRSARGLFSGSKGHAVKDLFHVKSLSSPALLPDHHALLTDLCERTSSAEPTPFHRLLASIDTDGRLLRCYTQNIDGLEERAGLRTGVPPQRKRTRRGNTKDRLEDAAAAANAGTSTTASATASVAESMVNTPAEFTPCPSESRPGTPAATPAGTPAEAEAEASGNGPEQTSAPRCIPLHGLLKDMHCSLCSKSVPLADYLPLPPEPIACPQCEDLSSIRSALSERQRRVGTLRASVVLYGEEHPEGELIGTVVERDLKGTGPRGEREGRADMLIVAGTSLAIPGVKRIVKEMAKALSARTPAAVRDGKAPPVRTVFLNAEPPAKPGEWDGVFDVWVQGDIQTFATMVADDNYVLPEPRKETPKSTPKKKAVDKSGLPTPDTTPTKKRARKVAVESDGDDSATPSKKPRARKATAVESEGDDTNGSTGSSTTPTQSKKRANGKLPLTPRPTPPRPKDKGTDGDASEKPAKAKPKRRAKKTTPTSAAAAKRSRAPSPSPVAKDDTKPDVASASASVSASASDSDDKSDAPFQADNTPYVDVPALPGPRSDWLKMCIAPSPPAASEDSPANTPPPKSPPHRTHSLWASTASHTHSSSTHSHSHSHLHSHPPSHPHTHSLSRSHHPFYSSHHHHTHNSHSHSHSPHSHTSTPNLPLPTTLPLEFPARAAGGTFEAFLADSAYSTAMSISGVLEGDNVRTGRARFSPPPPVEI